MKCPICGKEMEVVGTDISNNFNTGQQYSRTGYHCNSCDTWGNLEIPI